MRDVGIRHPELLGLCPVRELIRRECPGPAASEGPCSVIDYDVVLRNRADRWDWFGYLRLLESQARGTLDPAKAIAYASTDYAYRHSLGPLYAGMYIVHGYELVEHPYKLVPRTEITDWLDATFANGVSVNGVPLSREAFVLWLRDMQTTTALIPPAEFPGEHRKLERAVA